MAQARSNTESFDPESYALPLRHTGSAKNKQRKLLDPNWVETTSPLVVSKRTLSLFSFLLTMTAVICWSMKMRMTASRAGRQAASDVHHGLPPNGWINQARSFRVGLKTNNSHDHHCWTSCWYLAIILNVPLHFLPKISMLYHMSAVSCRIERVKIYVA